MRSLDETPVVPPRTALQWFGTVLQAAGRRLRSDVMSPADRAANAVSNAESALLFAEDEQERYQHTVAMLRKRIKRLKGYATSHVVVAVPAGHAHESAERNVRSGVRDDIRLLAPASDGAPPESSIEAGGEPRSRVATMGAPSRRGSLDVRRAARRDVR